MDVSRTRTYRAHLFAAFFYALWAIAWTYPLVRHLSTSLPGESVGDNATFVWNVWWMREALASSRQQFFFTPYLFAPFGIDLTLHTHTALLAFLGATVLGSLSVVQAENVLILLSLAFNGFAAFALAFDRTRHTGASLIGGLVYAGSTYIGVHLLGHFNLIAAGGLPLCAMFTLWSVERRSEPAALAAALTLAAVAYTDYYYLIFATALIIVLALGRSGSLSLRAGAPRRALARRFLIVSLLIDLAIVAAIALTGGWSGRILGIPISMTGSRNLVALAWLLALTWLWLRAERSLSWQFTSPADRTAALRALTTIGAVGATAILPLVLNGFALWRHGEYVAPPHFWRSGPKGLDLAALFLGNPLHPLWGSTVAGWYDRLGLDRIEGAGWIGVVPLGAVVSAIRARRAQPFPTLWLGVAALAMVWALGPWMSVGGVNTGLMLPQNLLSLLPVLSNARMPGRALIIVMLALSVTTALVIARSPRLQRTGPLVLLGLLAFFDTLPAPFPLVDVQVSSVYRLLAAQPPGITCELPFGLSDGFGHVGTMDSRAMLAQAVHGHPIVGGAVSRLPDSLRSAYAATPIVRSLLRLSDGGTAEAADLALSRMDAGDALTAAGIEFVVIDRTLASASLTSYVHQALPLRLLTSDAERDLYTVDTPR